MASTEAVPFYRSAGMTYITYSNICANLVRNCLKEPFKSEASFLLSFFSNDDVEIRAMALECVLEIGYFSRKEAIDSMLEEGLVKKLVDLQRSESKDFVRCVVRFAFQLEVGEGLRKREKGVETRSVEKRETIPHHVPQSSIYQASLSVLDLNVLCVINVLPMQTWRVFCPYAFFATVHFSQLGSLGLNKGDWFSFAKRRAPSPVCTDDNRSCMKHWKSGFFLIDRAHVIKLRDMPEGVLVLSGLSRVWKIMGIHDFLCLPEWTGAEVQEEPHLDDLAVGTPSSKILAKAKASQKRKASTSGATSSHVAKHTRSALAQSSGSTTRPSLFVGESDDESDGDDDVWVEIPLVTLIRSAAMIPSAGNQSGSSVAPTAEGSNTRGKGIMADDVVAPSVDVSRPRPSSSPVPSFKDVSGDAIHADFFPFSAGPYYATYSKGGVAGNCEFTREEWDAPYRPTFGVLTKEVFKDPVVCKTVVDQLTTPGEMVRVESLSDDQLTARMSVLDAVVVRLLHEALQLPRQST
ncbi:gypsy type transposase [Tanacetum coccineum]